MCVPEFAREAICRICIARAVYQRTIEGELPAQTWLSDPAEYARTAGPIQGRLDVYRTESGSA
jgi:hypothetical protein